MARIVRVLFSVFQSGFQPTCEPTGFQPVERQFIAGSLMGLVVFAPGVALAIIDALLWVGLTALAITVMRAVSGPSRDDRLARRPGHPV